MYKFKTTAKALHWLSALVILWATFSGLSIAFFDFSEITEHAISEFNVSLTVVFIPFFIWRFIFRLKNKPISDSTTVSNIESTLAYYIHWVIYSLVAIVLLTGILMMGEDYQVFHMVTVPSVFNDTGMLSVFSSLHDYSVYTLTVLVLLHIFAVIKHEYNGHPVLKKML